MAGSQQDFGWMREEQKAEAFLKTEYRKKLGDATSNEKITIVVSQLAHGSWESSNPFLTTARAYPVGGKAGRGLQISPTPLLWGNLTL